MDAVVEKLRYPLRIGDAQSDEGKDAHLRCQRLAFLHRFAAGIGKEPVVLLDEGREKVQKRFVEIGKHRLALGYQLTLFQRHAQIIIAAVGYLPVNSAIELLHLIDVLGVGIKRLPDILILDFIYLLQQGIFLLQLCLALGNDGLGLLDFLHLPADEPREQKQCQHKEYGYDSRRGQCVALVLHHLIAVVLDDRQDATHLYHPLAGPIEVGIFQ